MFGIDAELALPSDLAVSIVQLSVTGALLEM